MAQRQPVQHGLQVARVGLVAEGRVQWRRAQLIPRAEIALREDMHLKVRRQPLDHGLPDAPIGERAVHQQQRFADPADDQALGKVRSRCPRHRTMPRVAVDRNCCISAMSASASATSPRSASICSRAASSVRPLR